MVNILSTACMQTYSVHAYFASVSKNKVGKGTNKSTV